MSTEDKDTVRVVMNFDAESWEKISEVLEIDHIDKLPERSEALRNFLYRSAKIKPPMTTKEKRSLRDQKKRIERLRAKAEMLENEVNTISKNSSTKKPLGAPDSKENTPPTGQQEQRPTQPQQRPIQRPAQRPEPQRKDTGPQGQQGTPNDPDNDSLLDEYLNADDDDM